MSGIRRFSSFAADDYPCKIAGEVIGFDAARYFREAKSIKRSERFEHFAVAASKLALEDAKIDLEESIMRGLEYRSERELVAWSVWKDRFAASWGRELRVYLLLPSPE